MLKLQQPEPPLQYAPIVCVRVSCLAFGMVANDSTKFFTQCSFSLMTAINGNNCETKEKSE